MPWMFAGSATATRSLLSVRDTGTATTRCSVFSEISSAALGETRSSERSMNGMPYRRASERAIPSGCATPSSCSAWARPPMPARPRAAASRSDGTSSVAAISSAARSATVSKPWPPGSFAAASPLSTPAASRDSSTCAAGLRARSSRSSSPTFVPPRGRPRCPIPSIRRTSRGSRRPRRARRPRRREERYERDRHLAGAGAVADEEDGRRHERGDEPDHQRERDASPEHRAEQQRQLDVAHAEALRVHERGGEQEGRSSRAPRAAIRRSGRSPCAPRGRSPLRGARSGSARAGSGGRRRRA